MICVFVMYCADIVGSDECQVIIEATVICQKYCIKNEKK